MHLIFSIISRHPGDTCISSWNKTTGIVRSQYSGRWWPGDARGRGISSDGIDRAFLVYGLSIIRVKLTFTWRCLSLFSRTPQSSNAEQSKDHPGCPRSIYLSTVCASLVPEIAAWNTSAAYLCASGCDQFVVWQHLVGVNTLRPGKMADKSQTIFSYTSSLMMKNINLWLKFHGCLFLSSHRQYVCIGSGNDLASSP